jgi:hypothetical protein
MLFKKHRAEWLAKGGKITRDYVIISDFKDFAGTSKGHYFHQDLLVAGFIHQNNPKRHIDVGSRFDGFVAHVASFREIEVVDIRPLAACGHENVKFIQADLMNPQNLDKADSVSCLHAIEHFGLGRYSDPIDVDGHLKGIENLVDLVAAGGRLYISFPIGKADEVHFNAHRVFHPQTILSMPCIAQNMSLLRFDCVDDGGDLHQDVDVSFAVNKYRFGCGIYTFLKK